MRGIGIDIESVSRFLEMSETLLQNIFTESELEYCNKKKIPAQSLAGIFCAKEAVQKALWSAENKCVFPLSDIEIDHRDNGAPFVSSPIELHNKIVVSISHTSEYATAIALLL
jgi:holo-[acyl-carrier protein] synthase